MQQKLTERVRLGRRPPQPLLKRRQPAPTRQSGEVLGQVDLHLGAPRVQPLQQKSQSIPA